MELEGTSEKKEPNVFNKGEETLEPTARLLRFLYIGNDKNVIISERIHPISFDNLDTRLGFIKEMAALRYSLPFVLTGDNLRCNDECLLAIAYCLRRINNIPTLDVDKLRAEIYKEIPELLKTDCDMFQFVYFSNKLVNDDETDTNDKTSFGRGMKKALSQWYEKRSALDLANMFGRNRGMYGWYQTISTFSLIQLFQTFSSHCDIIHMCHMKFDATKQLDKAKVIATLFKRGSETIAELKADQSTTDDGSWPLARQRIVEICSLKVNESATDAAEMIKLRNFELGHLPVHLYSQHQVWDILVPKLNYRDLLKVFQTLHSLNLLKIGDSLSKKVGMNIANANLIKAAQMHPMEILPILKSYEKNQRYNESIKNDWYQKKKVAKSKLVPNQSIIKRLVIAVNHAMNHSPQTGCEFFVTLNLTDAAKKHPVLRMNQLTCLEAMVMVALTLKKREKNTKVYTFNEDKSTMLPVKITSDMTLEKPYRIVKKTAPSLSLPLKYGDKNTKNTIFITIVDSVARFCGLGEAPIEQFRSFRKSHTHSKFIVLNLRRNQGDLCFQYEKGFLEICGLTCDTWQIIHAFATNKFA